MGTLILKGGTVVSAARGSVAADVLIDGETIAAVQRVELMLSELTTVVDAAGTACIARRH